ncbi:MAG: hypothetical protein A7316_09325 [Candidatus Altiarchaeales archaeon WOR_SM1_86-2]|nr:MAG: hypothetical protein A7316_09325 [Candidatus Altiarchaeales archaeon WOR_SM1_86-2]ODS39918.1 MAG: hypothetical protein A7315_10120 [Candidatus Altiarchaeales archaeon WOR_SM1_79]
MDYVNLIKDGFKYATTDWKTNWKRLIVGGLLLIPGMYLLLIPSIFVIGYCYRSMQETIRGNDTPPDFNEWGDLFKKGIGLIGVGIMYTLSIWITLVGLSYVSGEFSTLLKTTEMNSIFTYGLVSVFVLTYGVFFVIATLRYADKGNFGSVFNFGEIFNSLKRGYEDYVIAMVLVFAIMAILMIPVFIVAFILSITVIGIIVAIPLMGAFMFCMMIFEYRVFANIYRETNKMQNKESKFNWKLPVYGAIGFAIGGAIWWGTIIGIIWGDTLWIAILKGIIEGATIGAIGGAAISLVQKAKKEGIWIIFASTIGFAIAGAIWWGGIFWSGIWGTFAGAFGGALAGALGGAAISLAQKYKNEGIWIIFASTIGFAIGGVIVGALVGALECAFDGVIWWGAILWSAIMGAIMAALGGAAIGLALKNSIKENK